MVVDRKHVLIGSCNLDPRSADINSELALLADSPRSAKGRAFFDDGISPENSYRVTLEDGRSPMDHQRRRDGPVYTKEPETSWWRRVKADALGLLPIHSML